MLRSILRLAKRERCDLIEQYTIMPFDTVPWKRSSSFNIQRTPDLENGYLAAALRLLYDLTSPGFIPAALSTIISHSFYYEIFCHSLFATRGDRLDGSPSTQYVKHHDSRLYLEARSSSHFTDVPVKEL
jgi:hypothetical protein